MRTLTVPVTVTDPATGQATQVTATCQVNGAGLRIGATTNIKDYGSPTWLAAAQAFNAYTGTAMATTLQRAYLVEGQWPAAVLPRISQLAAAGCRFQVCMYPQRTASPAERVSLANQITLLQRAGVTFDCVLVTKPNIGGKFPSAVRTPPTSPGTGR